MLFLFLREQEQLKNINTILQYLGGISAVGILNPPGGLDQNGHVRFRHKASYYVYFGCAEFAFLASLVGAVYLTVNVSRDAARIRRMLRNGFIILSILSYYLHRWGLDDCPNPGGEECLVRPDWRNSGCSVEYGCLDRCLVSQALSDGAVKLITAAYPNNSWTIEE
ncbi:unnamed protein product [Arabidopsis lyrata]|uniref:Predicted protein n=1 Tax=Arabidopsis lyrata subsp. lyrata TaxID=81972 RepID=D7MP64_ARALL|nr:predicted protein [Arabidopsis lyrata subsp. lyrata]CAH8278508.1 unnamed protein product [Arabidopsis lyrata]